jgi:hypothetical protein
MKRTSVFLAMVSVFVSAVAWANSIESIPVTVTGQVKFERRYTMVAGPHCGEGPCARSQSYWSVVVQSGDANYLIAPRLNEGEAQVPQYVEVAGVPLKPGSIIKVVGNAVSSSARLFRLTDIKTVTLLMDLGWACHTSKQNDPNIYVRLWYSAQDAAENGTFKIRVQQFTENAIYQLAYIDHARFAAQNTGFAFVGTSPSVNVELSPEPGQQTVPQKKFPATLRISQKLGRSNQKIDMQAEIGLTCSQTRFAPRTF